MRCAGRHGRGRIQLADLIGGLLGVMVTSLLSWDRDLLNTPVTDK